MTEKVDYSILIPAYNAEKTLGKLLSELKNLAIQSSEIIVVDDGSLDKTSAIALKHGTIVESLASNSGKGSALKRGFDIFVNRSDSDYLICMDADLQHPVNSIKQFIDKSAQNNRAVIVGKREINLKTMPAMRYLSNKITSFIISFISGANILDSQCGFRLIPKSVLKDVVCREDGFQFESEFILRCAEQDIPVEFVDIPTIYNKNGSSINHFSDTFKFIKLIFKEILRK